MDPELVRADVLEGWVSPAAAEATYGVILEGSDDEESLAVHREKTRALREERRVEPAGLDDNPKGRPAVDREV